MKSAVLQSSLPMLPPGAENINSHVALHRHDGQITFYTASGPIFTCSEKNRFSMRLAQGILIKETTVNCSQLAKALNISTSTVSRNSAIYEEKGARGFIKDQTGREPYKLKGEVKRLVQKLINDGKSINAAAKEAGISKSCLLKALKNGWIKKQPRILKKQSVLNESKTASRRSAEDIKCPLGVGSKREYERILASRGKLDEATPVFEANESVRYAGVLLALPILDTLGLFEAGNKIYNKLRQCYYGLTTILIMLSFMALLRIKNPEQLKNKAPGELGIILGLDRAPEVKTMRQKIKELGLRNKAGDFMGFLTRRWADQDKDALGFIYIDGHVRPYHGRKHKLPKTHVARRRLCMPATTDFWVNDSACEPLFLVTAEANDSMLSMLDSKIIPELKKLDTEEIRPTIIFDREGWSPDSFKRWFKDGIDVITYRKGKYDPWPEDCFVKIKSQVRGKEVTYLLGERSIRIKNKFWMREVRRLCEKGHQTSVMTTRQDLEIENIARRMFFRWNQENFFKYMREEYALDHLVTNDVEAADIERMVPNPEKKEKKKAVAKIRGELEKLVKQYGEKAVTNDESQRPTMRGFNIANSGIKKKILRIEKELKNEEAELNQTPNKVLIKEVMKENEIVRLENERQLLKGSIKMLSYRAETALLNSLGPSFARNNNEGRNFMKTIFQQPADIVPDYDQNILFIKFHTMANLRSNQSLKKLCETINETSYVFPGTDLKLHFIAPDVAFEKARGQEL